MPHVLPAGDLVSAAAAVIMLPTILIYVIFQRHILAGVAAGAVKE
ncbi:hypothetical protein [uncultured Gemmiger sp.]